MKKLILLSALCVLSISMFVIYSCSKKEDAMVSPAPMVSSATTDNVQTYNSNRVGGDVRAQLLMLPLDSQRIAYSKLSPASKNAVWKDKFEQVMSLQWTPEQRQWLDELHDLIVPALFVNESNQHVNFTKNIQPDLVAEAINIFDTLTFIQIIDRIEDVTVGIPPSTGGDTRKANCNTDSWFSCDDCIPCMGGINCDIGGGCGFLWLWECDGICGPL